MELSIKHIHEDRFNRYFAIAIAFHVLLVVFGVGITKLMDLDIFKIERDPKNLEIIQSSVRIDVVAMPKFTVQELKKMKVTEPVIEEKGEVVKEKAKEDIIKPDDIVIEKKEPKVDLGNLLSNLSKKEKKVKIIKGKKTGELDSKSKKELRNLILEGNKVSAGTSTVGDSLAVEKTMFNDYVSALPNMVRPYWKLPSYLMDQGLQCRIRVFIASNGKILNTEIYESSGNSEFDKKALNSLKQVSSFPQPKSEITARLASGAVVLGFPL
jgi:TonB family protein